MPLTLFDFVQQVENVTVQDIPDSIQDSIDDELRQQTSGDENDKNDNDLTNPSDARIVADTVDDLNDRAGFTSIKDAIGGDNPKNGAADSSVGSDGTIFVEPGTYNEKPTIDTQGVTLKGPNAGIAGDSDQRGAEASFQTGGNIDADNVTIDGFELVPGPTAGSGESRTEILGSNAVITNSDVDVPDGDAPLRLSASANDTVITQNQFASGDGGNFVINARQDETDLIDGVEITDNTFENTTGTGTTAIQAKGFTNADISGNSFDNIGEDAVRLAGNVSGTEVTGNEFSNYAQDSGFTAGAIVANNISGDNIDISSNQFNDAGGDDIYVVEFSGDGQAGVLALSAIEDSNTFKPSVVRVGDRLLPAVSSDGELKSALDADFEDAGDESEEGLGETIPLDNGYTSGLDGSAVRTQNVVSVEEGTFTQMFLDKSQINTDSSFTTVRGNEAISGAYIQENGQVQYLNVIIQGGNVFFFVPERLQGEEITFAVGNMNQDDGGDFAELSGDDIVTGKITVDS